MSILLCAACSQPLEIELDTSDGDDDVEMEGSSAGPSTGPSTSHTVPDDVHLTCNCHFHWDCLMSAYNTHQCPNCHSDLLVTSNAGVQQLFCSLRNEGGFQENLDILPLLAEEAYLRAHPDERKARAFLEFCRGADLQAVVGMLRPDSDDDEEKEDLRDTEFLRYQDPLGDLQSGLHAAVVAGSREIAWLLLLLASDLDLMQFPPEVFQEASALGLMRGDSTGLLDIRTLRDAQGRTADDLAREIGGVWHGWPGTGRLAA